MRKSESESERERERVCVCEREKENGLAKIVKKTLVHKRKTFWPIAIYPKPTKLKFLE